MVVLVLYNGKVYTKQNRTKHMAKKYPISDRPMASLQSASVRLAVLPTPPSQ